MVERVATARAPAGDETRAANGGEPGAAESVDTNVMPDASEEQKTRGATHARARMAGTVPARRAAAKPGTARGRRAKRRLVRWSEKRAGIFLDMLGQTGNVAASVRASGLSETSVYRRRRRYEEFRARWAVALREGFVKLETLMLQRALAGVEKPVWHGGKQVGTIHEYDNRLCLALLNAHRGTVRGEVAMAAEMSAEEMRAAVAERLAAVNKRLGGEG